MCCGVISPRSRISYPEKLTTHDLLSFRSIADFYVIERAQRWSEGLPWLCLPSLKNNSLALGITKAARLRSASPTSSALATNTDGAQRGADGHLHCGTSTQS